VFGCAGGAGRALSSAGTRAEASQQARGNRRACRSTRRGRI